MDHRKRAVVVAMVTATSLVLLSSRGAAWNWTTPTFFDFDEGHLAVDAYGNAILSCRAKLSGGTGTPLWDNDSPLEPRWIALDPGGNCIGNAGNAPRTWKVNGDTGVEEWNVLTFADAGLGVDSGGDVLLASGVLTKISGADGAVMWHASWGAGDGLAIDRNDDVVALHVGTVRKARGSDGSMLWENSDEHDDLLNGIIATDPAGDVLMAGHLESSSTFAVRKLSGVSGHELWRHVFSAPDEIAAADQYWDNAHSALEVDAAGNVIVAGRLLLPSGPGGTAFVVKLNAADGAEWWRFTVNSPNSDAMQAVAIDQTGDVFAAGVSANAYLWKLAGDDGHALWATPMRVGIYWVGDASDVALDRFGNPTVYANGGVKVVGATGDDYLAVCGNGLLESGETCDDANVVAGDGCSDVCRLENSFVSGNSTVTTGGDATPATPAQAAVTSPSGGPIEITRLAGTPSQPGFSMLDVLFQIQAPIESGATPLVLTFMLDASLASSTGSIAVFKDGAAVLVCSGSAGEAVPDPCVSERAVLGNGDVQITVRSSTASDWSFGTGFGRLGPQCGDGRVDSSAGEQCDDGNLQDGDCCTSSCRYTVAPAFACSPAVTAKGSLSLKSDPLGLKNALKWKWVNAGTFSTADLGTPETTTPLAFCLFDANGFVLGAAIPAGGWCGTKPCWKVDAAKGKATYMTKQLTPDGVGKLQGKSGTAGKGVLAVQGKGLLLSAPGHTLALPVRARLIRADASPACWETTFSMPDSVKKNDAAQFQAKSD